MSIIRTALGWVQLTPKIFTPARHTPTMLESMGITPKYDGVKAFADYANGGGRGFYYHYNADGTWRKVVNNA